MVFFDIFSKRKTGKKKQDITVVVDNREKNSLVAAHLVALGMGVEFRQLSVGDYVVQGVVIERKSVSDFKSSIVNKRIISQLLALRQCEKRLLLLEGIGRSMYEGGIHENAFRGFLLSVAFEYDVPVVFALDEMDSARYIAVLAQRREKGEKALRASRLLQTKEEQIQFILEGFPHIGPVSARRLFERFGSLRAIMNASEEELREVLGRRARGFLELVEP